MVTKRKIPRRSKQDIPSYSDDIAEMGRTRRPRHGVTELRWIGRRPSHCVAEVFRAGRLCNRIAESVWQCDRTAVAEISAAIQTTWHGGTFQKMAGTVGLEPTTDALTVRSSTVELDANRSFLSPLRAPEVRGRIRSDYLTLGAISQGRRVCLSACWPHARERASRQN